MKNAKNGLALFGLAVSIVLLGATAVGQESRFTTPPAGIDLSGAWYDMAQQDSGLGTAAGMLVDYGGIPINETGRMYALGWSPNRQTTRQEQCAGYVPPYMYVATRFRFWEDRDPINQRLTAVMSYGQTTEGTRSIFMDGRPHPPAYAAHSFTGFSTGRYERGILRVDTTHLKRGYIRATGLIQSDQAELVEYFIRHGDRITYFGLAEPMTKTSVMRRYIVTPDAWLYACDDGEQILAQDRDVQIPQFFWGEHPFLRGYSERNEVPLLAALGGPETMYPEFKETIRDASDSEALARITPSPGRPLASVAPDPTPDDGEIHTLHVQGNIYMLVGDGANIAVQVGDQGAFVIDTGAGNLSDEVVAAIAELTDKPIQYIANTSYRLDHTGGNVPVKFAGVDLSLPGSFFASADIVFTATIIGHQNVQNRMHDRPTQGWPSDTFLELRRRKYFNDEAIEIFYQPNAVTDGDSIVHFRQSDVIVTGDIFTTTQYPFIDLENGGSLQGEIDALKFILDRAIYEHQMDGGTRVIPGHGYLSNEYEVAEYRDMLILIRDRVQVAIDDGATLEEVQAARVSADFDTRYGSNEDPWTTEMFIEAVYTSLQN